MHVIRFGTMLVTLALMGFPTGAFAGNALRLGTNVWPGYEPLYLARHEGFLSPDQVRLVEFRSATQVMVALQTGSIDAAALTLDEVVTVASSGVPITIVLTVDVSAGADSIIARPGVDDMTALRGRRVGVENTALGAYLLLRALEVSGMAVSDVEVVRLEVARHVRAFETGEIVASVCFEPVRGRLLSGGGREIFTSRQIPGEIVDVIAVRTEALARSRESLGHLGDAWDRALDCMKADPDHAFEILGQRMGLDGEAARHCYGGIDLLDRAASAELLNSEAFRTNTMNRLKEFMVDRGIVEQAIAPDLAPDAAGKE